MIQNQKNLLINNQKKENQSQRKVMVDFKNQEYQKFQKLKGSQK